VLYVKAEKEPHWQKVGQTEVVFNNLSPNFTKVFDIGYYFEKNQIIRVDLFDYDDSAESELIGTFQCNLNKLLTGAGQTIKADL
jgi:Ca2+-dependent lipid-binding protein